MSDSCKCNCTQISTNQSKWVCRAPQSTRPGWTVSRELRIKGFWHIRHNFCHFENFHLLWVSSNFSSHATPHPRPVSLLLLRDLLSASASHLLPSHLYSSVLSTYRHPLPRLKKWEKLGTFSDDDDEREWEVSTPDEMGDKQKLLPPSWPTAVIPAECRLHRAEISSHWHHQWFTTTQPSSSPCHSAGSASVELKQS